MSETPAHTTAKTSRSKQTNKKTETTYRNAREIPTNAPIDMHTEKGK